MENTNESTILFKKAIILLGVSLFAIYNFCYAQQNSLSIAKLSTLDGQNVLASSILNEEKTILIFWESYNDDHAAYIENIIKEEKNFPLNVKIAAICYDNQGTFKHIKPLVEKRNWDIEIYIDKDRTLSNSVNLEQPLLTLIFNGQSLVSQFYGNKDLVDSNFLENRYSSTILN